ncbi:hypothetical protein NEOLEDRAFT_1178170 [Neolentinus lepideus HHB14362 ss-1]|uniref:SANT domain-containing protein n=1 Tax=Neolentinus lepideus HHB14362 ss-1 TaxID=1314782 RepID=A0A165SUR1_9AGAM|nr:hypothetical protein NEOLEDRAFT_1178170 [Neolentinus lepideus HHB14362 ss-1]
MSNNYGWQPGPGPSYMTGEKSPLYPVRQPTYFSPDERRGSYPYYSRDTPIRESLPYRDDYASYPGDPWRDERTPPRPGRHTGDSWRTAEQWNVREDSGWPDRRGQDTMAQAMASRTFEPSESWKQSHSDFPTRPQFGGPSRGLNERQPDHFGREFPEPSPRRGSGGYDNPPPPHSGDRYRPPYIQREAYDALRRYDSYRPGYEDNAPFSGDSRQLDFREYPSPVDAIPGGHRRDSRPPPPSRRPSPQYPDYMDPRSVRERERSVSGSSRGGPASPSSVLRNTRYRTADGGVRITSGTERSSHTTPSNISRASIDSTGSSSRKRPRSRSSSISSEVRWPSRGKGEQEDFRLLARPMAVDDHRTRLPDYHVPTSFKTSTLNSPSRKDEMKKPTNSLSTLQPRAGPSVAISPSSSSNNAPGPPPKQEVKDIPMSAPEEVRLRDAAMTEPSRVKPGSSNVDHQAMPNAMSRASSSGITQDSTSPQNRPEQPSSNTPAEPRVDTPMESGTAMEASPMPVEELPVDPEQCSTMLVSSEAGGRPTGVPDLSSASTANNLPEQRDARQSSMTSAPGRQLRSSDVLSESSATTEIKSLTGALCRVVQVRRMPDLLSRERRVQSVLFANLAIAPSAAPPRNYSPEQYVQEIIHGLPGTARIAKHNELRNGFIVHLANRRAAMLEHTEKLRQRYLEHHEYWKKKCGEKDQERAKPQQLKEGPAPSGRTTRRSAATMGDAVRSDLEMEQIIASLGNEDLTDATSLAARNTAKIPDMISVTHGPITFVFDDTNNRVNDPQKFYAPRTGLYDWTQEEKQVFCEKFATYPKQFGIIADFLPNKTTSQCVAYYYLHKKSQIDFRQIVAQYGPNKRRRGGRRAANKQKGNALLTDIRRHDAEVSGNPGAGSASGVTTRGRRGGRPGRPPRRDLDDTPTPTPTPDPEPRVRPRRNRVASRYAQNPDRGDEEDDGTDTEVKTSRKGRKPRKPRSSLVKEPSEEAQSHTSTETKFIDQTDLTVRRKLTSHANWTEGDKELFLRLLSQYGDDFKRIAASMPHKTTIQVTTFYRSNLNTLRLDQVAARAPKRSPTPNSMGDNWQDVHRPYPSSAIMPPARHDAPSTSRQDGPSEAPQPQVMHQYAQPTPAYPRSFQLRSSHTKPSQPTTPPVPPPPPGSQQVLDLRNGIIVDQRSTWFSAGSNVSGAQTPAGPLDPAGHFSGTVDLGLRMYQGIQPQVQYRPMGGPLPSLNVVLPGQGLRFGFTPEYNTYGRLPYQRSMPLGAAEPSHAPLPNRQDERLFSGQQQNLNGTGFNAYGTHPMPDNYSNGQSHWSTS